MAANAELVRSIKRHLAGQPSDELRRMLAERDDGQYSEEGFVAAQELLDERTAGQSREPPPRPPLPPELTPAQREAAADAVLRRQVRLIGTYYYCLAFLWLFVAAAFVTVGGSDIYTASAVLFAACFWLLGWSLRRFSPTARMVGTLLGILQVPAFSIGTIIGLYTFDKLMRADHLFGGKEHPGEREPSSPPDAP